MSWPLFVGWLGRSRAKTAAAEARATERPRPSRVTLRALSAGVVLTMLMAIFGTWNTWITYRAFQHIDNTELRLERLSGTIVFLDHALANAARMGALTGEPEWEVRYKQLEPQLDTAIQQTINLAPNGVVRQAAEQTDVANRRLEEMEEQSFDLARRGRLDDAIHLLDAPQYAQEEEAYAEAVTVCKRAIESRVDEELQHHIRRALLGLALTLASLLTLVFGWAGVLRIVRQGIEERLVTTGRLESAIRARDEFLSIASHELKTPLTTLKLHAETLTRKYAAKARG